MPRLLGIGQRTAVTVLRPMRFAMCLSGAQEGSDEEDASAEEAGSAEGWKPANKICSCFLGFVEARDPWKMPDEPSSSSWENPRRKPWEQACTAMVEPEASKAMLFPRPEATRAGSGSPR